MVIEGDSALTTSDTTLSCNPSSVNLGGDSSYVHLDDYIDRVEFTGGGSSGFPLDVWTHGYLDFTIVTWKGGSTLRGTRE